MVAVVVRPAAAAATGAAVPGGPPDRERVPADPGGETPPTETMAAACSGRCAPATAGSTAATDRGDLGCLAGARAGAAAAEEVPPRPGTGRTRCTGRSSSCGAGGTLRGRHGGEGDGCGGETTIQAEAAAAGCDGGGGDDDDVDGTGSCSIAALPFPRTSRLQLVDSRTATSFVKATNPK